MTIDKTEMLVEREWFKKRIAELEAGLRAAKIAEAKWITTFATSAFVVQHNAAIDALLEPEGEKT